MNRNQTLEVNAGLILDLCSGIVTLTERRKRYFRKPPAGRKKQELMELKASEEALVKKASEINQKIYNLLEGPNNG